MPAHGRRSPITDLTSVDLPAPFGPTIVTISPGATVDVDAVEDRDVGEVARRRRPRREDSLASAITCFSTPGSAEVRLDHALVAAHVVGRPAATHPPLRHHDHVVGVAHHDVHVVLDEQDRTPRSDAQLSMCSSSVAPASG